jgi:homoserine dehydrogenase
LLSLAIGQQVNFEAIPTEGITVLTQDDFAFAAHFGYAIKLIADGRVTTTGVEALIAPMLVHNSHPFSAVTDVFNGVLVHARMTDNVMFIGRGAGKLPTASAVVSDIVDISKHLHQHVAHSWSAEPATVLPLPGYSRKKMIRISYNNREHALAAFKECVALASIAELPECPGQLAWMLPSEPEQETNAKLASLAKNAVFSGTPRVLRIFDPIDLDAQPIQSSADRCVVS